MVSRTKKYYQLQDIQKDASRVARGKHHWQRATGKNNAEWLDFARKHLLKLSPEARMKALQSPIGDVVEAWVSNNRWIARCNDCGGQETVDPDFPQFMCLSCFNAENDHYPRPLDFGDIEATEEIMIARPDVLNRCMLADVDENSKWKRKESIADLEKENIEYGLEKRKKASD